MPNTLTNAPLAPYTSFKVGGPADKLVIVESYDQLLECLEQHNPSEELHILGYGANVLISDKGLRGLTLLARGGSIKVHDTAVTADAGVWWDDLVANVIDNGLWGLELMSAIPGSVGAAAKININAYGQAFGDRCEWVEAWSPQSNSVVRIPRAELSWGYKSSVFQQPGYQDLVILRVGLALSEQPTTEVTYASAIKAATDSGLDLSMLDHRRRAIIAARTEAKSLWEPDKDYPLTAGSFFRNPIVDPDKVKSILEFDETHRSLDLLTAMNKVHGGTANRVSASHVLLAAGFERGQTWGQVRLHPEHVLKLENIGAAKAQDLYHVANLIQTTVKSKLDIDIEFEAVMMGDFDAQ